MSRPLPLLSGNNQNNPPIGFVPVDDNNLYQVDIMENNNFILITCKNTLNADSEINIYYSCKLTSEEIQKKFSCSISEFIEQMRRNMNMMSSKIQKKDNYILLFFLVDGKNDYQVLKLFEEIEEAKNQIEIKTLKDAIDIINILKNDNKYLKNEINHLNKKYKIFDDFINKMKLNCFYNSFDTKAYLLEPIFNNLKSKEIIKTREEFCLINSGIKHLFNKNINSFDFIFNANEKDFEKNILTLQNLYKYPQNLITLILTKDDARFGKFGNCLVNIGFNPNICRGIFTDTNNNMDYGLKDFVFSLGGSQSQIYYYNDDIYIPSFILSYDANRQSLYGNESTINSQNYIHQTQSQCMSVAAPMPMTTQTSTNNQIMMNNNFNNNHFINLNFKQFKLSGKKEFNIQKLEIYRINYD